MRKQCAETVCGTAGQRDSMRDGVRDSMRKQLQSVTQSVGQRDTEETKRNETKRNEQDGVDVPSRRAID